MTNILMHPAVSRAQAGIDRTPALDLLVQARAIHRNTSAARANAIEDAQAAMHGAADPAKVQLSPETLTAAETGIRRKLAAALAADGLPADLRQMIQGVF